MRNKTFLHTKGTWRFFKVFISFNREYTYVSQNVKFYTLNFNSF